MNALVLADGSVFIGTGFGADEVVSGEVVFNTAMSGYQEVLTDPSYVGQIVVMSAAEIGNVGCNRDDEESARVWPKGFVVHALSPRMSSHRGEEALAPYLQRHGVSGMHGVDTRQLVRKLRSGGVQMGAIGPASDVATLQALAQKTSLAADLTRMCATEVSYTVGSGARHVVAIDFGLKRQMLTCLVEAGCRVTVMPPLSTAEQILALSPDGVFLTNGPGDPALVEPGRETVRALLGRLPIFGICLGHQLLALALGARTFKLPFGHRGANQPVVCAKTGRVDVTTQNHGYAVDEQSLPPGVHVTHRNANDGTVEGIEAPALRAMSVQHHPEASPGPHDARRIFSTFVHMMEPPR